MQYFDSIRQLRSAKEYETATSINMSESNSSESNPIIKARERNIDDEPEVHVQTQEEKTRK